MLKNLPEHFGLEKLFSANARTIYQEKDGSCVCFVCDEGYIYLDFSLPHLEDIIFDGLRKPMPGSQMTLYLADLDASVRLLCKYVENYEPPKVDLTDKPPSKDYRDIIKSKVMFYKAVAKNPSLDLLMLRRLGGN